jgi:hypothetical protein
MLYFLDFFEDIGNVSRINKTAIKYFSLHHLLDYPFSVNPLKISGYYMYNYF